MNAFRRHIRGRPRRGKILIMFALLLPVLIGGAALSVDTGVVGTSRSQQWTAADAAALAGAAKLADDARIAGTAASMTLPISNARSSALALGAANRVLGAAPVMYRNDVNDPNGDVVVGYYGLVNGTGVVNPLAANQPNFNSVTVSIRRTADHGGLVPSAFSALFGNRGTAVTVTSTAVASNYRIRGFRSQNSQNAHLLPIVLDQTTYSLMIGRAVSNPNNYYPSDNYTYNSATGAVTSGADGVKESNLYPVKNGNPGNWGTIKVGVSNNSTSVLGAQIRNGITPDQLATFPNSTIALDTSLVPPSITFSGNPGISAGIKDDLASIIGQPVTIPVYDQSGGNGNNAWYRVVEFAPARILDVSFQGNPKYVVIQPAIVDDPAAVPDTVEVPWSYGGVVRVHLVQ